MSNVPRLRFKKNNNQFKPQIYLKKTQCNSYENNIQQQSKNNNIIIAQTKLKTHFPYFSKHLNLRIITYVKDENNYGQRLQNYALQRFLSDNFNCNVLTYDIRDIYSRYPNNLTFRDFENDHMKFKAVTSLKQIQNDTVDFYIFGGDQIYSTRTIKNSIEIEMFFMENIDASQKIMYSASENDTLTSNSDIAEYYRKSIKKFKYTSFRELDTVDNLRNFNIVSEQHIDPVFLLNANEWRKLERKPKFIHEHEIFDFTYVLNQNENEIIKTVDGVNNYICRGQNGNKNYDPREWLWMIDHCRNLYTSSFHGVCFSIIFNKKLSGIQMTKGNSFRINNLFKLLNMHEENTPQEIFQTIHGFQDKSLKYFNDIFSDDVKKHNTSMLSIKESECVIDHQIKTIIPKNIFMLWFGKNIPSYVNYSVNKMKEINSDFNVIFIHEDDPFSSTNAEIHECLDMITVENTFLNGFYHNNHETSLRNSGFAHVSFSDVFRYYLINKYGGIYVDCDTLPIKHFDDYLISNSFFTTTYVPGEKYFRDGFFFGNSKGFINNLRSYDSLELVKTFNRCLFNYVPIENLSAINIDYQRVHDIQQKFIKCIPLSKDDIIYDRQMLIKTANFEINYYLDHFFIRSWK